MRLHSDVHQGLSHGLRISLVRQGAAVPREDGCLCGWVLLNNPLGFKHHPLEGAGLVLILQTIPKHINQMLNVCYIYVYLPVYIYPPNYSVLQVNRPAPLNVCDRIHLQKISVQQS